MIEATRTFTKAPGYLGLIASSVCTDAAPDYVVLTRWINHDAFRAWVLKTLFTSFCVSETTTLQAAADFGQPAEPEACEVGNNHLHALNNELAVLARENARKSKELHRAKAELQAALDELQNSYWHLRKIAEVLPMCAVCGKVDPGMGDWETVVDYLRRNSLFLSHGYCPECETEVRAEVGLEEK